MGGVNKISDTKTNYIAVAYTEDNANGEFYVSRIDYTGNDAAGVAPYASVQFGYEVRLDVESGYEVGSIIKITKRLISIGTYNGTTTIKNYKLTYNANGSVSRSLLSSLSDCDNTITCLPTMVFKWKIEGNGFTNSIWTINNNIRGSSSYTWVADFNGDGKADIASAGDGNIYVHLSTGTSFSNDVWTVPSHWGTSAYTWVADFNGDGKADIATAHPSNRCSQ